MTEIIFGLLCGIGTFLFAIYIIDSAFDNEIKLPEKVEKIVNKPLLALLAGMISAAITQSSSAINSILATLRDKDCIKEKITWFAIAGSNVGTTVTAYLAVIQNASIGSFFSCVIFFSTFLLMLTKKSLLKRIAIFLSGFSLIFISFYLIKKGIPEIVSLLNMDFLIAENPAVPFFFSLILTAICQSSALVSVIIVTLAKLNVLTLTNAIFMIMAANLGTCVTIFLVSIGKSKRSLRVAIFNLLFNLIPVAIFVFMFYTGMLNWFILLNVSMDTKIALFHTLFNVSACLMICPFIGWYADKKKLVTVQ